MPSGAQDLQLRELKDTVLQLKTMLAEQTELIKSLRETVDQKTEHEKVLQEQIDYLTKKLFGRTSEERVTDIPGQLSLFDEAEQEAAVLPEPETVIVKEHTRKAKATHQDIFKGVQKIKKIIPLEDADKICPVCRTEMVRVGEEYVRREIVYVPARCEVIEYYREVYTCPECKLGTSASGKPVFTKSEVPAALIPGGYASDSAVAWTMYQKYCNSIPLYRQEKDWKQYGAEISRTTLANWIIYCSEHYLRPVYDYFHRELIRRDFVMADETRVQVLHEPERKAESQSFMWVFRSGEDGLPAIVLYSYSPTRQGDHAAEFLNGFQGYLTTDGYQGYNKVPDVKRYACWSHIRRYFIDAVPKGKQFDYSQPAVQGVQYCDRLFRIEDSINKKHPGQYEERKQLRLEKEKPVLEAFWSWFDQLHPVKNSRLDKACTYVRNRRDISMTYLEDGRCSFSNNLSENSIRPFTVGRKNWLFSSSVDGVEASSIVYSMVEMARVHGLNVSGYLQYLLSKRPDQNWTDDRLSELAPWSPCVDHLKT